MPLKYWLPAAVWMAVILWLSSDVGSAEHTEHLLVPLLHLMAPWATPTQLLARGRRLSPRPAAATAFAISLIWAVLDEARQSLVPTRTASAMDVAIDGIGALLATLIAAVGWRKAVDRTTTLLLWTGLVGGAAFLLLNAIAGVSSGFLWLTAPLAAVLLIARTMYARHARHH